MNARQQRSHTKPLRASWWSFLPFIVLAIFAVALISPLADAKGSPSFKGGFSSYKAAPKSNYRSAPKAEKPKNNFGSFQKEVPVNAAPMQKGSSADMSQAAAKQNAWNSYQNGKQTKWENASGGPGGGNNGNANKAGWDDAGRWQKPSSGYQNSAPQQVNHHHYNNGSGGGFMQGLMWFMIGQSWASHHNNPAYHQPQGVPVANGAAQENTATAAASEWEQPLVEEKESVIWSVMRLLLWVGFLWLVIVVIKQVIGIKRFVQGKRYSLRSF